MFGNKNQVFHVVAREHGASREAEVDIDNEHLPDGYAGLLELLKVYKCDLSTLEIMYNNGSVSYATIQGEKYILEITND